jgi:hypothetical protein
LPKASVDDGRESNSLIVELRLTKTGRVEGVAYAGDTTGHCLDDGSIAKANVLTNPDQRKVSS